MVRRRCAACGNAINRLDRFFEASDGTLCQDCQTRMSPPGSCRAQAAPWGSLLPPWAVLPVLDVPRPRRG